MNQRKCTTPWQVPLNGEILWTIWVGMVRMSLDFILLNILMLWWYLHNLHICWPSIAGLVMSMVCIGTPNKSMVQIFNIDVCLLCKPLPPKNIFVFQNVSFCFMFPVTWNARCALMRIGCEIRSKNVPLGTIVKKINIESFNKRKNSIFFFKWFLYFTFFFDK